MKNDKKTALYIRVSTEAQREEGYSIEAQYKMLEGYCASKNIKEYEFYIDGGFTGSNIDRPELQRLICEIKDKKIESIVVYKLDRLSRSQKDTLYLIEDVLNPNGVSFVSLNENMDTSTPIGRAMLGIMSAFAQLERETIKERTKMGMRERINKGLWRGGGNVPFGYDYDKESGKLVPNKDAETVKLVFSLYLDGRSAAQAAALSGLKYERMAIQMLKRVTYTGDTPYNGEIIKNTHEPIISREIFERVQTEMKRRAKSERSPAHCLLAGFVYCGVCGCKMRYQKWGKSGYKIYCYSQDKSKAHLSGKNKCDNIKTDAAELEEAVLSDLFSLTLETDAEEKEKPDVLNTLISARDNQRKRLSRLYSLYSSSEDDVLLDSISELKEKIKETENQIKEESESKTKSKEIEDNYKKLGQIGAAWEKMNFSEKRLALRELIDRIVITYDKAEIYYSDNLKLR